ncbi:hypothetical protein MJO28_013020 [Puccinia striiformis f. sp. tritici]|uniref:Uncharacterized protein n=2 Tax=Puccinia striiformis TaxID=27350 RepID=A0A2S4W983_9BASI|nr:hypothetical protein MJO28_013020 [Puccinia striiformis f. sp. tritici]POW18344.1 hypothetical protein PSHT_05951 [Puccinia striiformis]
MLMIQSNTKNTMVNEQKETTIFQVWETADRFQILGSTERNHRGLKLSRTKNGKAKVVTPE